MSSTRQDLPQLTQVVVAICQDYLDKGHHIFADQLYSSVPLVEELESRETGYTGIVDARRQQLPSEVRAKLRMQRGESRAWRDGKKWCWLGGKRESQQL